jgi:hypothetical protein
MIISSRYSSFLVSTAWWLITILFCSFAIALESAEERFVREAPQKWMEYRKVISHHTEGTIKQVIYNLLENKRVVSKKEYNFTVNLDNKSLRSSNDENGEACNAEYSFMVRIGSGDNWRIEDFRKNPTHFPPDLMGHNKMFPMVLSELTPFGDVMSAACKGQKLWEAWFPYIVAAPAFKLKKAEYVRDNTRVVRIEYEFEPTEKTGGAAPCRSGMVILDTKRYWQICQAETETVAFHKGVIRRGKLRIESEFNDDNMPVPFVWHQIWHDSRPKSGDAKQQEYEWVFDIDMRSVPNPDKKQFTLSSFGLPEPRPIHKEGINWLLYFGLGFLSLICIFVARFIRRRHSTVRN